MEHSPPPLFNQGPSARVRLTIFVLLSLGLLGLDAKTNAMEVLRKVIGTGLYPLQQVASAPVRWGEDTLEYFSALDELKAENEALRKQQLVDRQKLHGLSTLQRENQKLRQLMNVANTLKVKRSFLTEVVSDANDPFSRKIIVSKGSIQGISEGMPVIDEL
ncbi:MAG: rod shape-determining protein MreC, partial [Limnobacter sp.]|nr:rod shape-determining protein MreC [Limnobacter sp.]